MKRSGPASERRSPRLHGSPSRLLRALALLPWLVALAVTGLILREVNQVRLRRWQAEVREARSPLPSLPETVSEPVPEAGLPAPPPPPEAMPALPHRVRPPQPAPPPDPIRKKVAVILEAAANGNYYAPGLINGRAVRFVVDTGASAVAIPDRLRWQLNLTRGRYFQGATANGLAGLYETRVKSLAIGSIRLSDVPAVLYPNAADDTVLLGMTALREVRMAQEDGRMVLEKEIGTAAPEAEPPPPGADPVLKRSVQDCLKHGKVIDDRVLRCMRGTGPEPD